MTADKMAAEFQITRREALTVAFAGGGALFLTGVAGTAHAATNKVPQKTVSYRGTPNGASRCDNCLQWQAPASCKVVAGAISAAGWCTIYAPKH
jgi:hypothetical protein